MLRSKGDATLVASAVTVWAAAAAVNCILGNGQMQMWWHVVCCYISRTYARMVDANVVARGVLLYSIRGSRSRVTRV